MSISGAVSEAVVDVTCHAEEREKNELSDAQDSYAFDYANYAPITIFDKEYHPTPENIDSNGNFVMKLEPGEITYFDIDKWFLCCHCKQQYVTLKCLLAHFSAKHKNQPKQYVDKITNSLRVIMEIKNES